MLGYGVWQGLTSSSEDGDDNEHTEVTEAIEAEPREETPGLTIRHGGHWTLGTTQH